jgi:hypothetical protein
VDKEILIKLAKARKKLISSLGCNGILLLEDEVLAIIDLIEAEFHMRTDYNIEDIESLVTKNLE